MAFDRDGNLYATTFAGKLIAVFDRLGNFVRHIGEFGGIMPESIVFDAAGNFYVGDADRLVTVGRKKMAVIVKFDPDRTPVRSLLVDREKRGSDWNDLAGDQCTLYYTSEGKRVLRYDVCTDTHLPDFATDLPGSNAYAIRILPDGGALVAETEVIVRLDSAGLVSQTYDVLGQKTDWFALNRDPDGRSFWSGEFGDAIIPGSNCCFNHPSRLYKFDIDGGYVRFGPVVATQPGRPLGGLAVLGEQVEGAPPHPANLALSAVAGQPVAGVEGSPVTLDGSDSSDPDGDSLSCAWDFGDSTHLYLDSVGNRTRATGQPDRQYDALDQVVGWDREETLWDPLKNQKAPMFVVDFHSDPTAYQHSWTREPMAPPRPILRGPRDGGVGPMQGSGGAHRRLGTPGPNEYRLLATGLRLGASYFFGYRSAT